MISARFAIVVSILLTVALVPTIIHNYIGAIADDGLKASAISNTLAGFSSNTTARRASWVKETFDSFDWIERKYTGSHGENVLLFVARSYDLKRLYHHPEIGLLRGVSLRREEIIQIPGMNVPIHVLKSPTGKGIAAYVLLYDGQFVKNPIHQQVLTSIKLLFSTKKPMTLFFVYDSETHHGASLELSPAINVLVAAVNSFFSQDREMHESKAQP